MRDVKLPDSMVNAQPRYQKTLALHGAAVYHAGCISGDENENLGRVGEHNRLNGELGQNIIGEVIDENAKEGEAAKKIKPEVTLHG
jgi:formate dehydrogenase assembly factor FdhD